MIKLHRPKINLTQLRGVLEAVKLILMFILFLLFVNFNVKLSQEINATKALSNQLASSAKQRTDQINNLSHHIDCIIDLFGVQNRTSYYITNPKTCHISVVPAAAQPSTKPGV